MLDCHSGTVVDFPCCTIDHSSCVLPPLPRWMRHGLITLACVPPAAFLVVMASRHPHWRFRGLLSVHLRCGPHDLLTPCWGLFKECFSPFVTSCTAPCASGRSASWPGRTFSDGTIVPWQGTHNNHCENLVRPVALGRKNWLFAGSLRAGQRAAAVMSLIQSAMLNGHDPYAYLKDVLTRLPITKHKDIGELLPHNWRPAQG